MDLSFEQIHFATPEYDYSIHIRDMVLRKPLGISFTKEQLAEEWDQFHLVAVLNSRIIAVLVLKPVNNTTVKMRQVAVHPEYQKKGIGQKLVAYSEHFSKVNGYGLIELHAREIAVPFYEKLNYRIVGDLFEEVGIPHFKMEKQVG